MSEFKKRLCEQFIDIKTRTPKDVEALEGQSFASALYEFEEWLYEQGHLTDHAQVDKIKVMEIAAKLPDSITISYCHMMSLLEATPQERGEWLEEQIKLEQKTEKESK